VKWDNGKNHMCNKTTSVIDHLLNSLETRVSFITDNCCFQFVILNLFISSVLQDKIRLFKFKYLIQQLRLEFRLFRLFRLLV